MCDHIQRPKSLVLEGIVRVLFVICPLFLTASECWADSIRFDDKFYDNVLIREGSTQYYVQVPESGDLFIVPKEKVKPGDVTILDDEEAREKLLEKWSAAKDKASIVSESPTTGAGKRTRALPELVGDDKYSINVTGYSIQSVRVTIDIVRRSEILEVLIPPGTIFEPIDSTAQTMVASEVTTVLVNDLHTEFHVPVLCANRSLPVPHSDVHLRIVASPHRADLARLIPVIEKAEESFAVNQAATWIVTDDASYRELGHLTDFVTRGRVIGPDEATRALTLLKLAGINIRNKRIWSDRSYLISHVTDAKLKRFLSRID